MNNVLPIAEFGRQLITTGDLDPIYIALRGVSWEEQPKYRFLTAYSAYYHAGVACYMAERPNFWQTMMIAAANTPEFPAPVGGRWPRAKERRHFRGAQALAGVADWSKRHPNPDTMFPYIAGDKKGVAFTEVRNRALEHRSVGEWLSFKVADLCDACLGIEVDQSNINDFMYESPRNAALKVWADQYRHSQFDEAYIVGRVVQSLQTCYKDLTIPHKPGQPIDMFVIETVLCKWGSHCNGHYNVGTDIHEIRAGLEPWTQVSELAQDFLAALPPEVTPA